MWVLEVENKWGSLERKPLGCKWRWRIKKIPRQEEQAAIQGARSRTGRAARDCNGVQELEGTRSAANGAVWGAGPGAGRVTACPLPPLRPLFWMRPAASQCPRPRAAAARSAPRRRAQRGSARRARGQVGVDNGGLSVRGGGRGVRRSGPACKRTSCGKLARSVISMSSSFMFRYWSTETSLPRICSEFLSSSCTVLPSRDLNMAKKRGILSSAGCRKGRASRGAAVCTSSLWRGGVAQCHCQWQWQVMSLVGPQLRC